jgi:hypothetical protein
MFEDCLSYGSFWKMVELTPPPPHPNVSDKNNINNVLYWIFFKHNYAGVTEADKDDLIHMMAFGEKRPPSPHIRCVHKKKLKYPHQNFYLWLKNIMLILIFFSFGVWRSSWGVALRIGLWCSSSGYGVAHRVLRIAQGVWRSLLGCGVAHKGSVRARKGS